jgi:protein-S-isoprenylcysteine O-methyltransferase Ste14
MADLLAKFATLPAYGIAALIALLLYAVQSEIRFGKRARSSRAGVADRGSTLVLSVAAAVPVFGLVLAMKKSSPSISALLPAWFNSAALPLMPAIAWTGVAFGGCGLALRLWAVLTLRERYSKTLLIQEEHPVERGGPYLWVRHPGYLGSLLTLNGIALASGNWAVLLASLIATLAAYTYRIRIEDKMLVAAFGDPYVEYQRRVRALLPIARH